MPLRHLLYASVSVTPPASLSHLCRTSRIPLWIYSGSLCSHLIFLVHFPHAPVCPTVQAAFMCHVTWGCHLYDIVSVAPPICICRSFSMPLWHLLYASVASPVCLCRTWCTPLSLSCLMHSSISVATPVCLWCNFCMPVSQWHLPYASVAVAPGVCVCRTTEDAAEAYTRCGRGMREGGRWGGQGRHLGSAAGRTLSVAEEEGPKVKSYREGG